MKGIVYFYIVSVVTLGAAIAYLTLFSKEPAKPDIVEGIRKEALGGIKDPPPKIFIYKRPRPPKEEK